MRDMLKSLVIFAFTLLSIPTHASLSEKIDALVNTLPENSIQGILVQDMASGKTLYSLNENYNLLPASTLKILTAFSAYQSLGADFKFSTRLYSQNKTFHKKQYRGDLHIEFNGDPSLTHDHLAELLDALKRDGVREIQGRIWLDNTAYNGYPRSGGTSWDDWNICFAAPSTAIILDRNCFFGWLKPTRPGHIAEMEYDQPHWRLAVENHVVTREPLESELLGCVQEVWPSEDYEYRLEGCIQPNRDKMRMAFSANNVERAARRFVQSELKRLGIALKGPIKTGKPARPFQYLLTEHQSEPLTELLYPVLEKSDNVYSDSILKTLGRQLTGDAGSYYSGSEQIRAVFSEEGVPLLRSRIVDGSGLSRYNLISATDMNKVLTFGWQQWGDKAPWLVWRSKPEYWFKSGYLNGVNNMAGYAFDEDGKVFAFTIFLNGLRPEYPLDKEKLRAFNQDVRNFHRSFLSLLTGNKQIVSSN